ncbi:hypothetical protein GCM10023217_10370 [Gordonia alkaliphila]|uniref:Membrane protein insertase YidC n=1 Tax=Gordonia alkaliphila TaxID=1053547 RepID=A0ABP8Z164_9ACTN
MLNFIYYPVSWIMWVWHWVFDKLTPDSPGWSGLAWALSVVFLVFTLRAILYKPFVKQIRTTKKMQEINPQMQAIRKKYKNDRVKMTEEMQKLQKEHGFNPLLGCLPMLLQIPVFIGLFHVLRSFNRMGTGMGQEGLSAEATRSLGNYAFSPEQVENFLDSRLFGVPLSSFITQPTTEFAAFLQPGAPLDFTRWQIAAVVVPLMIVASFATHMNSRASVARQTPEALENPQTRIMNRLSLWIFPLGILVTGPFFPVAILLYWVANNGWTYVQQHIVFGRIAKEEDHAKAIREEKRRASAPRPGERPLPGNFAPGKAMDRGYLALAEGRVGDAIGEFRKVTRYGQRNTEWAYKDRNGLVQAADELVRLSDDAELRASLAFQWTDAARKEATAEDAEMGALDAYLTLRRQQLLAWLNDGHDARLNTVMREDNGILTAYEEAWEKANENAPVPELSRDRKADWARMVSIAMFRAGKFDDARIYARQAAAIYDQIIEQAEEAGPESQVDVAGYKRELAQVKLIAAAPSDGTWKQASVPAAEKNTRELEGREGVSLLGESAGVDPEHVAAAQAWHEAAVAAHGKKVGGSGAISDTASALSDSVLKPGEAGPQSRTEAERRVPETAVARENTAPAKPQQQGAPGHKPGQRKGNKGKKNRRGGR